MIEAILTELETLKAKVDAAIQHVKAGVTTLNEDQQAELKVLVNGIENEAGRVADAVHGLVDGVEQKADGIIAEIEGAVKNAVVKVEGFLGIESKTEPSAADLDAAAAEQQAAADTAPEPPAAA